MAAPTISDLPWLGILLALVWNFLLGFTWYAKFTPMGRIWMKAMNVDPDAKPQPGEMLKGLLLMILGAVLTMSVLAYLIVAMKQVYDSPLDWMSGVWAGGFVWLGFLLPIQLGGLAWEKKTVAVTLVNAGYNLLSVVVGGILIAVMAPK